MKVLPGAQDQPARRVSAPGDPAPHSSSRCSAVPRSPYKYVPEDSKLDGAFCTTKSGVAHDGQQCSGDRKRFPHLRRTRSSSGVDLSVTAPNQITTVATIVAFSFVSLSVLSGFMQSRQASRRTPQTNKQMATIMKVLLVAFGLFSLQFPAGLVLYFCVSNFWRLGQQEVIFRRSAPASSPTIAPPLKSAKAERGRRRQPRRIDTRGRREPDDGAAWGAARARGRTSGPARGQEHEGSPAQGGLRQRETGLDQRLGKARLREAGFEARAAANGAKPIAPPAKTGGGLRSFFQLPPPPGEIPKAAPGRPATSKSALVGEAGDECHQLDELDHGVPRNHRAPDEQEEAQALTEH